MSFTPAPLLTAAQVKARQPRLVNEQDAKIEQLVSVFDEIVTRYRGVAYRTRQTTYTGTPRDGWLELPNVEVSSVVSLVDDNDSAVTYTELDAERGRLKVSRTDPLTCTYQHGLSAPSELVAGACAEFVMRRIVADNSGTSRDVLSQNFDGGTTRYSTPDAAAGRPTGFLQIDADLNLERDRRPMVF